MSDKLEAALVVDVVGAQEADQLASAVASVQEALQGLVAPLKSVVSLADKAEQAIAKTGRATATTTKEVKAATTAFEGLAKARAKHDSRFEGNFRAPTSAAGNLQNPDRVPASKFDPKLVGQLSTKESREATAATEASRLQVEKLENMEKIRRQGIRDTVGALREQRIAQEQLNQASEKAALATPTGPGSARGVADRFMAAGITAPAMTSVDEATKKLHDAKEAVGTFNDRLANTRYALYSFSASMGIAGLALGAMNIATVKVAADMETMLATIERTSGATGSELAHIQEEFLELGRAVPASFADLGKVAGLAGQLDIPAANIADFTEVVAKFTATTNVNVDTAATAFGRLDALLPGVKGNYEALGSSILNVGVNSVATESEIIATTSQIAAAGAQADFTAGQVIGLAASYASLGVAPEAARGTTIRVFNEISTAVSEGGESLETFARLSGKSAEEFQTSWGANSGDTFVELLQGMQAAANGGENLELALRDIGITATRDLNALLKLSQNAEIVADNFQYAGDGFDNATKLGDSFAIIAETLNAKLQTLANSVQELFARLGAGGIGMIGEIVSGLQDMVNVAADLADNPIAQALTISVGIITALSAVLLLAGSGAGRLVATMLAGRPVMDLFSKSIAVVNAQLAVTQAVARMGGVELSKMQAVAQTAGVALKGAFAAVGGTVAITAAIAGVTALSNVIAKAAQSSSDFAKQSGADMGAFATALRTDTAAWSSADTSIKTWTQSVTTSRSQSAGWVAELQNVTGVQVALKDSMLETTNQTRDQTLAIGENARAWIANTLAATDSVQQLIKAAPDGFDQEGFFKALIDGDIEATKELVAAFGKVANARAIMTEGGPVLRGDDLKALTYMNDTVKLIEGNLENASVEIATTKVLTNALGGALDGAAQSTEDMSDEAATLSDQLSALRSAISGAFEVQNLVGEFADNFYVLIGAIATGGVVFDEFTNAGRANLDNLLTSIGSTIAAGQTMGLSAAESVAILFQQLQQSGVDTAQLMAKLSGSGLGKIVDTKAVGQYLNGTKKMSTAGTDLADVMTQVADNAKGAAAQTRDMGRAAAEAAPKIVTLADYANDLGGVINRAFEIEHGPEAAADAIQQTLNDLEAFYAAADKALEEAKENLEDARETLKSVFKDTYTEEFANSITKNLSKAFDDAFARRSAADAILTQFRGLTQAITDSRNRLRDLRSELGQMQSDKSTLQYQLGVAVNYKDDLRAADIRAQLATLEGELADNAADAAEEQANQSRELTGNSAAAVKNRTTLQDLAGGYKGYIESLVATGASTEEVAAATEQARKDFQAQGLALGFTNTQLAPYVALFKTFSTANANAHILANEKALKAQKDAVDDVKEAEDAVKVATDNASRSTEGNTNSAIRNRETMRTLTGQIGAYATALASSGAPQDEIKGKIEKVTGAAGAQITQLGFNRAAWDKVRTSIEGVKLIIDQVPRNITVTTSVHTSAAARALTEFFTQAQRQGIDTATTIAAWMDSALSRKGDKTGARETLQYAYDAAKAERDAIFASNGGNSTGKTNSLQIQMNSLLDSLNALGYAKGGYTGNGGTRVIAGPVHGKEFVIDAPNTARLGLPFLNALNNGHMPTAQASARAANPGVQVIEIGAASLAAIGKMSNVTLQIGDKVVAQATDASHLVATNRGSN